VEFGQVAATKQRLKGEEFTFKDHLRGLILSNGNSFEIRQFRTMGLNL